jgi:MYXO-CTERM domain-containing protein
MIRRWLTGCIGLASLLAARGATAHQEFPGLIAGELNAQQDPPCSVCHLDGKTSGATVVTLFGWSMRAHGLGASTDSVVTAIRGVKADGVDSDGDGVPDWKEIVDGTNPNAAAAAADGPDPQLGCRIGGGGGAGGAAPLLIGALVWLIRRRRSSAAL